MTAHSSPTLLERLARYVLLTPVVEGRRVLDLGCQDVRGLVNLAEAGASEIVGVTTSPDAMGRALADAGIEGIELQAASGLPLPFEDGAFDLILLGEEAQRLQREPAYVAELRRVLSEEGYLAVPLPNPKGQAVGALFGESKARGPTYEALYELLQPTFGQLTMFGQSPVVASLFFDLGSEDEDPGLSFDRALMGDEEEQPGWYLMLFGPEVQRRDELAIVQLPHAELPTRGAVPVVVDTSESTNAELEKVRAEAAELRDQADELRAETDRLRKELEEQAAAAAAAAEAAQAEEPEAEAEAEPEAEAEAEPEPEMMTLAEPEPEPEVTHAGHDAETGALLETAHRVIRQIELDLAAETERRLGVEMALVKQAVAAQGEHGHHAARLRERELELGSVRSEAATDVAALRMQLQLAEAGSMLELAAAYDEVDRLRRELRLTSQAQPGTDQALNEALAARALLLEAKEAAEKRSADAEQALVQSEARRAAAEASMASVEERGTATGSQLAAAEERRTQAESALLAAEEAKQAAEKALIAAEERGTAAVQALAAAEERGAESSRTLANAEERRAAAEQALAAADGRRAAAEQALAAADERRTAAEQTHQGLLRRIEDLENTAPPASVDQAVAEARESASARIRELEDEAQKLADKHADERRQLEQNLQSQEEELALLRDDTQAASGERERVSLLTEQLAEANQQKAALEQQAQRSKNDGDSLELQVRDLMDETVQLRQEIDRLQQAQLHQPAPASPAMEATPKRARASDDAAHEVAVTKGSAHSDAMFGELELTAVQQRPAAPSAPPTPRPPPSLDDLEDLLASSIPPRR